MSWQPSINLENLKKRAKIIQDIRSFFINANYLEVETPIMGAYGVSDPYLENIMAQFRSKNYFLQTSPEYHMKRLIAAGSGSIFQLSKVFRDDELGRWHNPEFSMLEWYKVGSDHFALMAEIDNFFQIIANWPQAEYYTYQEIFLKYLNLDPIHDSLDNFKQVLDSNNLGEVLDKNEDDRDQYLFLLMTHLIEPKLALIKSPIFIYNYPISQASLARDYGLVAARFEVYYKGIELANGFFELCDAKLQEQRFLKDNIERKKKSLKEKPIDKLFLQALEHGLPNCAGVALGVDRFIALLLNEDNISSCMSFDFSRA